MKKYLITIFVFLVLCVFTTSCHSDEASKWHRKGVRNYKIGLYGDAIEYFNKSISLNPDNPDTYYWRGRAYCYTYRIEEAISDFTIFIESNPNSPSAYYWRGRSYNEIRDFESAISDYSKAIELDPENAEYYVHRGTVYSNNSKIYGLDEAERDYRKSCELGYSFACHLLQSLR